MISKVGCFSEADAPNLKPSKADLKASPCLNRASREGFKVGDVSEAKMPIFEIRSVDFLRNPLYIGKIEDFFADFQFPQSGNDHTDEAYLKSRLGGMEKSCEKRAVLTSEWGYARSLVYNRKSFPKKNGALHIFHGEPLLLLQKTLFY